MDRIRRNERLAAMTRILVESPNKIFTLGTFCEMFGAAKSTLSEDIDILRGVFGVRGQVFRDYANGIESEPMTRSEVKDNSYGNSVTTPQDLKRPVEADATMLALCESVAGRLESAIQTISPGFCLCFSYISWWITPSAAAATR